MISQSVENIRRTISAACTRCGRRPEEVTLVGVSKTFPAGDIRTAVEAGLEDIGENYVQEMVRKREECEGLPIRWHFIGHLQRNKVKQIVEWVHLIHAVDSRSVAEEIHRRAQQAGRTIDVLVEINTTGESSKFGIQPGDTVGFLRDLSGCSAIRVAGLMTMGPFLPDPEASRPMFRMLRLLKEETSRLAQANVSMQHLSMGMTGDFEVAIEEGATLVRIGTAIFGARTKART